VVENGIYVVGVALVGGVPLLVELGVLLDVFVAVFIMSIAAYHISREFDHIDVDQLDRLRVDPVNLGTLIGAFDAAALVLAGVCLVERSSRRILILVSVGGAAWACLAGVAAWVAFASGPIVAASGWLYVDALSAYHLALLGLVQGACSIYAWNYFGAEIAAGSLPLASVRRFGALWFGSAAAMVAVLTCNNLGLMWVGIEATTLLTAFLISVHVTPLSLEATWKYLLVCSVGVAFAFVGMLLVAASASQLGLDPSATLLWTRLHESAGRLGGRLHEAGVSVRDRGVRHEGRPGAAP